MIITRALVLDLHRWNDAQRRSRAAYNADRNVEDRLCANCGTGRIHALMRNCRECAPKVRAQKELGGGRDAA